MLRQPGRHLPRSACHSTPPHARPFHKNTRTTAWKRPFTPYPKIVDLGVQRSAAARYPWSGRSTAAPVVRVTSLQQQVHSSRRSTPPHAYSPCRRKTSGIDESSRLRGLRGLAARSRQQTMLSYGQPVGYGSGGPRAPAFAGLHACRPGCNRHLHAYPHPGRLVVIWRKALGGPPELVTPAAARGSTRSAGAPGAGTSSRASAGQWQRGNSGGRATLLVIHTGGSRGRQEGAGCGAPPSVP